MRILFDGRILKYGYTGAAENYARHLLEYFGDGIDVVKPVLEDRLYQQAWVQTILPYRAGKYDLLFCPANIAPVVLPEKTRLVLTLHDVAFKSFPMGFSGVYRRYCEWVVPRNIARADCIVTVSRASEKEIVRFYPEAEGKITVIPPGISALYRPVPGIRKKKQFLYVGSVNERKNVAGVIEAFLSLPAGHGYRLVLAGNYFGNFALSERTLSVLTGAEKRNDIVFMDSLDEEGLLYAYNASRCLVFPSFHEGFGLPPLEAMACGIPVIASGRSAMPEVCGGAELSCNPHDVTDIAEKMQRMIEDDALHAELKQKGLARARRFSWEAAAGRHRRLFEEVYASVKP